MAPIKSLLQSMYHGQKIDQDWFVYTHGGQQKSDWKAVDWAKEVETLGAGEILLTSMD